MAKGVISLGKENLFIAAGAVQGRGKMTNLKTMLCQISAGEFTSTHWH